MGPLALSLFLLHPHFLKIQLPTGGWEKSGFPSWWPRSRVLGFFFLSSGSTGTIFLVWACPCYGRARFCLPVWAGSFNACRTVVGGRWTAGGRQ